MARTKRAMTMETDASALFEFTPAERPPAANDR